MMQLAITCVGIGLGILCIVLGVISIIEEYISNKRGGL